MFFFKNKKKYISNFFGNAFVDIHSHLLPGIDDGAPSINTSMELIDKMHRLGIKNFITTPHVMGSVYPNSSETIQNKLKEVQEELINRNMNNISIKAAAEYMLDEQFSALLKKNDLLTIKDNYILVEMSYFNAPNNLFELLFEIQLKGYKPILAHPERYQFFHHDFKNYQKLKNSGCLFQLNLLSLTTHYGKHIQRVSHKLLKNGMFDFIGTDTHHMNHLDLLTTLLTEKNRKILANLIQKNSLLLS